LVIKLKEKEEMNYDADAIQTAGGWDLINNDDQFIGHVLDAELVELELSGLEFHKFPFRGFGRLS
jgi:hypothetical protein